LKSTLVPTFKACFEAYWLLWFGNSNTYSVVSTEFKLLLESYFSADSVSHFKTTIAEEDANTDIEALMDTIQHYLNHCNQVSAQTPLASSVQDPLSHPILKHYKIGTKTFAVNVDSELVLQIIHPAIAHLSLPATAHNVDTSFVIYQKEAYLYLFKDKKLLSQALKKDYHQIQGKFIMHLLCDLHNKPETDWIGTFHGSTITDGHASMLFVGESGKGKSTLCALLTAHGFDLLADDVSPLLSENQCIYHNPLALSIKKGAFDLLQPLISNFEELPAVNFKTSKGPIKYVPRPTPKKSHYPCKAIILVNYTPKAETLLESVSIKTVLETLIPESWLSPNPLHAKQFINWLETLHFYRLTYSDTQTMIQTVSELFKTFKKPQ